jgi:hypothetical protein
MKKYFLFILLFCTTKAFSQVSVEYLNIVTSAAEYTYVGVSYKPNDNWMTASDWDRIQNALNTRQAMYDRGYGLCSNELRKLMKLNLINKKNKQMLMAFQQQTKPWADEYLRNADLSIQSNVDAALNIINLPYAEPDVRNEIRLLNELNSFYQYIKEEDPYKVNKGMLYENFNSVMEEIKDYNSTQLSLSFDDILDELRQRKYNEFKTYIFKKFENILKSPKVSNGWHLAYFLDKNGKSYGQRSVFVENGKVKIYKRFNGKEENIISGGLIKDQYCQSAIYNLMNSDGVFVNIDVELFFMD